MKPPEITVRKAAPNDVRGIQRLYGILIAAGGLLLPVSPLWGQQIGPIPNLGCVIISPKGPTDGGDFGPDTPGTQTAGFQEAVNFAVANKKDVFVVGGGIAEMTRLEDGGMRIKGPVWYILRTTLRIPPAENLRIIGGLYSIGMHGYDDGDVMVIDSQKNFTFDCGLIGNGTIHKGHAIIKVKPQNPRPDGVIGFTDSVITTLGVIGGGTVMGGQDGQKKDGTGIGLLLDGSAGPVAFNKFHITEVNACEAGLVLEQGDIHDNVLEGVFNHATNFPIVVKTGSCNRFNSLVDVLGVGIDSLPIGVNISGGSRNIFDLIINNGFGAGNALVFGPEARDNLVRTRGLALPAVTNNAGNPTNRVGAGKPGGLAVPTPVFPPSGRSVTNRSSSAVLVTIEFPGQVSSWVVTDNNGITQTVSAGLYAGQLIHLSPGESICFEYAIVPSWRWQAFSGPL